MNHLPLFAELAARPCLVVGGGPVGERRVRLLLEAGAAVTLLAPEATEPLSRLAAEGRIEWLHEVYDGQPLGPYWLIVAATPDRALNARVARAAEAARRFCNVVDDPALCSFIMPAIVERGPITIAVSSGGRSPVLSRWLKGLIESLVPQQLGLLAELAGRWRERVRAAIPDIAARRRFWQRAFDGTVAQHAHAGRAAEAERALDEALTAWPSGVGGPGAGEAWLVGAGPGSADLITLRGRQLLAQADVVLYDRLIGANLLSFARRDAELICVGKTPGQPSITQKQLNRLLVELVASGKRVCRLKGGDPMVFGRAGEELEALAAAGLPFQIVPGVSAVEGCAAYAGIPLTMRGAARTVLLATGHTQDDARGGTDLAAYRPGQTLALYMGVARYEAVAEELVSLGHAPDTPVAVVESGTTDRQRVVRTVLRSLGRAQAALDIRPPALLLVGETTRLAERYAWFTPGRIELFDEKPSRTLARVS